MNWTRSLAVVGLIGAAGLTGCDKSTKQDLANLKQRVESLERERDALRDYLGGTGPLYQHLEKLGKAVCQLEVKVQGAIGGLNPDLRVCRTGPGDITSPPKYPK
jgi:hypothetical protein